MKIYIDTREKTPWDFSIYNNIEVESLVLDVGDYYIEHLPDLVIERKKSTGEIATNLGQKWKQFEIELKKMKDYENAYIICEFPMSYLDVFPENSGIPEYKLKYVRMNANFMKTKLFSSCRKYDITPLFFNDSAAAVEGLMRIINNNGKYKE